MSLVEVFQEDLAFLPALLTTLQDLAVELPLILVFSMLIAVLLARVTRGQLVLRAVYFLPVVIGSAAVIQQLFNAQANQELLSSTLAPLVATVAGDTSGAPGLITPVQAVVSRLTTIIWQTGVQILLFVAGLNSVPASMYEAAEVDGATGWESFWKITLPMLSPVILVGAIYGLVDSFTAPHNVVVNYIVEVSFRSMVRLDYGAALGLVYFLTVFLVMLLLIGVSSKLVFYQGERK